MRKLAMLAFALLCLGYAAPVSAQSAQSAPQPGLPPGASVGAPNAVTPPASGRTTTITPMAAPAPMTAMPMDTATPAPIHRRARRHYRRHRIVHTAPVTAPAQ